MNRTRKDKYLVSILFILIYVTACPSAWGITIVNNSLPTATIVLLNKADNPVGEFAASELHRYIQKMSGASLPVVRKTVSASSTRISMALAILTGNEVSSELADPTFLNNLFLSMDELVLSQQPDGFTLKIDGNNILFAGSNDRGTLYAVYRFLEELGVRFFAPQFCFYQGFAEKVPSQTSISISNLNVVENPSFTFRALDVGECNSITPSNSIALVDWMAKNNLNFISFQIDAFGEGSLGWDDFRSALIPELQKRGIILEVGKHGVYDYFLPRSQYQASHPDWYPSATEPVVGKITTPPAYIFHITNQEALGTFINNALQYLQSRPEISILSIWPPDGNDCTWAAADVNQLGGKIPNAPAFVLNSLKAQMTGVGCGISGLAYSVYTNPPSAPFMYDSSTTIKFCPYDRSYQVPIYDQSAPRNVYYANLIKSWRNSGFAGQAFVFEYYRKYSWHSLPISLIQLIGQDIPYYASLNVQGMSMYSEPADWVTYELLHLLFSRLLWDKSTDVNAFLASYLSDRFGPTAPQMSAYFSLVESAGRVLFDRAPGNYQDLTAVSSARDYFLNAKNALSAAQSLTQDNSALFLIGLLQRNADFAIADTEISYYTLTGASASAKAAMDLTQQLIEENRFAGIILQCAYSMRRYDSTITWDGITPWVIQQYQKAFSNNCLNDRPKLPPLNLLLLN